MNVLATRGVQSEAQLAFAGLQQLLRPVRSQAAELTATHQAVLDAALGVGDDQPPEHFRIALAVLDLLSNASTDRPLLLVAEDAHWLDQPSVDVLSFVARGLESDPIVLLAAAREGYPTVVSADELPELRLQPLDPESATQLLGDRGDHLSAGERSRILREAAGNPLALVELPSIAHRLDDDQLMPGLVPVTECMERAFAARAADLPLEPQLLLLVAALNDGESVGEVLQAGRVVADQPVAVEALQAAADVTIVQLDEREVRFRHPLMRSAVRQSASVEQRRRVHEALAETLEADPDRQVWHRAALISGTHEDVAVELEEAGRRARRRGALHVAITALRRAAELSDPAHRGRPSSRRVSSPSSSAGPTSPGRFCARSMSRAVRVERALAAWIEEMIDPPDLGDAERAARVVDVAERAGDAGDRDLHVRLLWLAISRAWWTDPGPAARRILVDAARRLGGPDHRTRACSPSIPAPIKSATRPRPCLAYRPWRPRGRWIRSPCGTWGQRRSSSAPSTSLPACSPPPRRERARRGGWASCPGCSFSTASSPRSSASGMWPFPLARRRGGSRPNSADRSGSREARPSCPWSPACEATRTPPSAAPNAPSSWDWAPAARSPSPRTVRSRAQRVGRQPPRRRLRVRRAAVRPGRSGLPPGRGSLAHRRPGGGRAARRPRRRRGESCLRRWRPRPVRDRRSGSR
jgi:hypothetical protein